MEQFLCAVNTVLEWLDDNEIDVHLKICTAKKGATEGVEDQNSSRGAASHPPLAESDN